MVEGREATEADRITLAQEENSGLRGVTLGTAGALCSIALIGRALITADTGLTTFFFVKDLISLLIIGAVLIAANSAAAFALLGRWSALAARPRSAGLALSAIIGVGTLIGTSVIYHGFALSYDEVMAEFDAKIFRTGTLIHAVPSEWRPYLEALAPHFLLPVPGNDAWVSAYLPVNAMMRALFACVWSPTLTGPVLAAIAVAAIVGVARRLWPDRPDAAIVAALLLATAPQVLITAMTPYAMTGHLALNLVWLWLDAAAAASRRQAAARFEVGVATAIRWAAVAETTGTLAPRPQGRPPGSKLDAHETFLRRLIDETDDITLEEMRVRLQDEQGLRVGLGTLWRFLAARDLTYKKRQRTPPSRSAPM